MKTDLLKQILDQELRISSFKDGIIDILCSTDPNASNFSRDYLKGKSGLMLRSSEDIKTIYFSLFPSKEVFEYLYNEGRENSLLFIKHPLDWEESGRGFIPIEKEQKDLLLDKKISLYSAHSPLDNSVEISPSFSLAKKIEGNIIGEITIDERNYGWIVSTIARDYTSLKSNLLGLTGLNKFQERFASFLVRRVAVVSGGGDSEQLLEKAIDAKCDTYVSGILYFRGSEYARKNNPKFIRELKKASINAFGLSHYASEAFAIKPVKDFLEKLLCLPIIGIPEKYKLKDLKTSWGCLI